MIEDTEFEVTLGRVISSSRSDSTALLGRRRLSKTQNEPRFDIVGEPVLAGLKCHVDAHIGLIATLLPLLVLLSDLLQIRIYNSNSLLRLVE